MSLDEAVHEVYRWQWDSTHSFYNMLLTVIAKADKSNRLLLGLGFPNLVHAYELWYHSPIEEEFFAEWGIKLKRKARDTHSSHSSSDSHHS